MDERAPAGRRITPFLIEDGYEVRHLLPDGGETPYPAYVLRVRLLLPDGGENALSGLRTGVLLLLPDGGENALSGLRVGFCFCRPDKRSAIRQFTKPGQRED
ncbi:hypothetical protein [Kosakonia cowanii]|uniref:hypothetical protein n=1 Tax=Kosakonia cowanii TaxID=208223 RepID=UPI003EEC3554